MFKNIVLPKLITALKEGLKIALIFVFLATFTFGFFWRKDIAAIFNYPSVYGEILSDAAKKLFKPSAPKKSGVLSMPEIQLVPSVEGALADNKVSEPTYTLSIPALNITAPLLVSKSQEPEYIESLLKKGVVAYPSSLPGQKGATIILGHSAPSGWPRINYDWIFSDIHELKNGEVISINSPSGSYSYRVTKKIILEKDEDIQLTYETDSDLAIILLTCWPPGVDYKRIAVQAELLTNFQ